jgi:hypothetical protein
VKNQVRPSAISVIVERRVKPQTAQAGSDCVLWGGGGPGLVEKGVRPFAGAGGWWEGVEVLYGHSLRDSRVPFPASHSSCWLYINLSPLVWGQRIFLSC